jgi:hypothetical protein
MLPDHASIRPDEQASIQGFFFFLDGVPWECRYQGTPRESSGQEPSIAGDSEVNRMANDGVTAI